LVIVQAQISQMCSERKDSQLTTLAEELELHSIGRELAALSGQGDAQDLPVRPTPPPKATPPAPAPAAAGFTPDLFG